MFLALDSVFGQCSVALLNRDFEVLSCKVAQGMRTQTHQILPMVDAALNSADLSLDTITAIIFNRGPGAFSGIRINTAVTQALSVAHDIPCVGISSLQVMAQAAFEQYDVSACYAAHDARMKQVYLGRFEVGFNSYQDSTSKVKGMMQPRPLCQSLLNLSAKDQNISKKSKDDKCDNTVIHNQLICETLLDYDQPTPKNIALVGDGAPLLKPNEDQRIIESLILDAAILGRLGVAFFNKNGGVPAEQALPVYLRNHAWKTLKEQGKA